MIVVAENLAVLGFSILGCKFLFYFFFLYWEMLLCSSEVKITHFKFWLYFTITLPQLALISVEYLYIIQLTRTDVMC